MAHRKHLWPLFLLPVAAVLAFVWLGPPRGNSHNNAAPGAAGNGPKVADLGGRARELPAENAPSNEAESDKPPGPEPEGGEPPVEEATNTAREIDIYLGQLAHATKVNDQRGQTLAHESLKKCRPSELVDERVLAALESEGWALTRMQFFKAFHAETQRLDWARAALDKRAAKFLGTDSKYEPNESHELEVYAGLLLTTLVETSCRGDAPDTRCLDFVRNTINAQRPDWAVKLVLCDMTRLALSLDAVALAKLLESEVQRFLERPSTEFHLGWWAFWLYALSQDDLSQLLARLDQPGWRIHVHSVLKLLPDATREPRGGIPLASRLSRMAAELESLVDNVLAGSATSNEKYWIVQALPSSGLPGTRQLIEAGIQRKDANLGDYLAAWGRVAKTPEDLKLLAESAAAADSATATGAIEGLRQCALNEAAAELARIVEQGGNPGLQSQALGALLARDSAKAEAIVESYLGTDRDASVRAVAVAHIPAKNIDRMKKVVDEDASPRVRQAALTRLGDMKDKKLRSYFLSVAINDPQPLIRQQAKKYAEELKD